MGRPERAKAGETLESIQRNWRRSLRESAEEPCAIDSLALLILLCAVSKPILNKGVQRRPTWRDYYR
jgi:hypothetical protein